MELSGHLKLFLVLLSFISACLAACKSPLKSFRTIPENHSRTDAFTAPTSFCKCTCFSNSTIIPLGGAQTAGGPSSHRIRDGRPVQSRNEGIFGNFELRDVFLNPRADKLDDGGKGKKTGNNCNDCNRLFCLDYNLPICKGAKEEDVFTTCFQRDSRKDEAVVFIFIFATAGLLIYAGLRPWVDKYIVVCVSV
jgi:hypothetical protein